MPHRTLSEALGLASLAALALMFLYVASLELAAVNIKVEQISDLSNLLLVKKAFELAAKGYEVTIFIPRSLNSPIIVGRSVLTIHDWNASFSSNATPCLLEPGNWYRVFNLDGILKVVLLR